jgi:hypothetical protein
MSLASSARMSERSRAAAPRSWTRALDHGHRCAVVTAAVLLGSCWARTVEILTAERGLALPGGSLLVSLGATGITAVAAAGALLWVGSSRPSR